MGWVGWLVVVVVVAVMCGRFVCVRVTKGVRLSLEEA